MKRFKLYVRTLSVLSLLSCLYYYLQIGPTVAMHINAADQADTLDNCLGLFLNFIIVALIGEASIFFLERKRQKCNQISIKFLLPIEWRIVGIMGILVFSALFLMLQQILQK